MSLESCLPLARQIERERLRQFIEVRPRNEIFGGLPMPFEWKILSGHRRFVACSRILKWATIPCFIRIGMGEEEAVKQNVTENIEREQLTFMEEAIGIRRRFPDPRTPIEVIAKEYQRPKRWVKARLAALSLPKAVQEDVNKGVLTEYDIEKIARKPTQEGRLQALEELYARKKAPPVRKEARPNKAAIERKLVQFFELYGEGGWLYFGRWVLGQISEEELDRAIDNMG